MPTGFNFTEKDVKNILKERECELIGKYKGVNDKITIIDKHGYKYYGYFTMLKNSKLDKPFTKDNVYTIKNIHKWIKLNKYEDIVELISTEYVSAINQLKWKCKLCNSLFERSWHTMHKENTHKSCRKCNEHKRTINQTHFNSYKDFEKEGYTILGSYNGKHKKITLLDSDNFLYYTDYNTYFGNNRSPYLFSKFNPYTIHNINQWIKNNKLPVKLISEEFISGDTPLEWECECGNHFFEICCNVLKGNKRYQRIRCEVCSGIQSSYSLATEKYLQELKIKYKKEHRITECRDKRELPFDYAVFENEKLLGLIEVQGGQHYYPSNFKNNYTEEDKLNTLKYVQYHDKIKKDYCDKNNIPLLTIAFWKYDKKCTYKQIINNFIEEIN